MQLDGRPAWYQARRAARPNGIRSTRGPTHWPVTPLERSCVGGGRLRHQLHELGHSSTRSRPGAPAPDEAPSARGRAPPLADTMAPPAPAPEGSPESRTAPS